MCSGVIPSESEGPLDRSFNLGEVPRRLRASG